MSTQIIDRRQLTSLRLSPFLLTTDAGFLTLPSSAPPNARRASAIKPARVRNIAAQVLRSRSAAGKVQPNIDHRDICAGSHGAALQTRHPRRLAIAVEAVDFHISDLELRVGAVTYAWSTGKSSTLRDGEGGTSEAGCGQICKLHARCDWKVDALVVLCK